MFPCESNKRCFHYGRFRFLEYDLCSGLHHEKSKLLPRFCHFLLLIVHQEYHLKNLKITILMKPGGEMWLKIFIPPDGTVSIWGTPCEPKGHQLRDGSANYKSGFVVSEITVELTLNIQRYDLYRHGNLRSTPNWLCGRLWSRKQINALQGTTCWPILWKASLSFVKDPGAWAVRGILPCWRAPSVFLI